MKAPLYREIGSLPKPPAAGNLGLWYTRFFDRYSDDGTWSFDDDAKRRWIAAAAGQRPDPGLGAALTEHIHRRIELVKSCGGDLLELRTCWHFVTGLGLPHPVENGFTWHPTLGLPYLPATGVKGLLSAWLLTLGDDEDRSPDEQERAREQRRDWCGAQDDAGSLIIFDALPTEPPSLTSDVMTPHMGKWYAEGGALRDPSREPQRVPADWHSPVPVPFLVVERATFLFAIAPRPGVDWGERDPAAEVAAALGALEQALATLGAGAKTAIGYGRFQPGRSILHALRQEEAEAAEAEAESKARAEELARFEGFDPSVADVVGAVEPGGFATRLLGAMDGNTWSAEVSRELAARLQAWLVEHGDWVADAKSKAKKASKNKKIKNALEVMKWLER